MKMLLIMRHGKSSWKNNDLADHDRPLTKRGRMDVPRMGALVRDEDLVPDIILCSTAKRARETTKLFIDTSGFDGAVKFHRSIYQGCNSDYIDLLRSLDQGCRIAMVVGHNPGLEELLSTLADIDEWMPTACIAQIRLNFDDWQSLNEYSTGELVNLWRPREVGYRFQ